MAKHLKPKAFVKELLDIVPELIPIYEEHLRCNDDELLAHVLMGDVSRYVVSELRAGLTDEQSPVARAIRFFEQALTAGNEDIQNIIYVSFVENVAEYVPELPVLRELMGPHLREMLVDYEPWMKGDGSQSEPDPMTL